MKRPKDIPGYVHHPDDKIYSNKLFQAYFDFMDERMGSVMTDHVLARIGVDRVALGDLNGYTSDVVSHAITMAAIELTGEKRLSYIMGRNLPKAIGKVAGYIAGVTSPGFMLKGIGQVEERLALATVNQTTRLSATRFKVEITYRGGYQGHDYICLNRIGCYESSPVFFGLPHAKVEHPQCQYRGEGNCVYYVTFPAYGFLAWKRVAAGLFLAALAATGVSFGTDLGPNFRMVPEGLMLAAFGCFAWYKHLNAKQCLGWSETNYEGLETQNLALDGVANKLGALQKLTAAVVQAKDTGSACAVAARGLVRDLRYGSGQVWLLDAGGEDLRCASVEGYPDELRNYILEARFNYRDTADNPYGLLAQTMLQGKTVIVNRLEEILPRLTGQTQAFLKKLNLTAFIISPLMLDGRPLGVMSAEFHAGEKVEAQDQNIFETLALVLTSALTRSRPILAAGAS